jgi:hypothetical protein
MAKLKRQPLSQRFAEEVASELGIDLREAPQAAEQAPSRPAEQVEIRQNDQEKPQE